MSGNGITLPADVLVAKAREVFSLRYPPDRFPHLSFDLDEWDLRPINCTAEEKKIRKVRFTVRGQRKRGAQPLPRAFVEVVKAWLVLANHGGATASRYANACRYLWEAVEARLDGIPFEMVDWSRIDTEDLYAAERIAGRSVMGGKGHTKGNVAHILKHFAKWLDDNEICPGLEWMPITKKKNIVQHATREGRKKRLDRLPTNRAIEALAMIYRVDPLPTAYHEAARSPALRLVICAVGLLMVTGLRVNELVTLPEDCLKSSKYRGKDRWYIRYWNEKTRRRAARWGRRWLSPLGAELAQGLVAEIRALTKTVRRQARALEKSLPEGRVHLPAEFRLADEVTIADLARLHGVTVSGMRALIDGDQKRGGTRFWFYNHPGKGRRAIMRRADVERHLIEECANLPLVVVKPGNGQEPQTLGQTLLIFSRGRLMGYRSGASPIFVDLLQDSDLHKWLGATCTSRNGDLAPSLFSRCGLREPDGANIKMRPHQARHWLNTVANKAGMTALQITLWMQRADAAHTLYYLHDEADLADLNREGIAGGTIVGPAAEVYAGLSAEAQSDYLDGIRQAHKLKDGYCHAEHLDEDCEPKKICELCKKHARTKANVRELEARRKKRAQVDLALTVYQKAIHGGMRLHPRLVELYTEYRGALDRALDEESDAASCGAPYT